MTVDKTGVDKMVVDETGVARYELGCYPWQDFPTEINGTTVALKNPQHHINMSTFTSCRLDHYVSMQIAQIYATITFFFS